MDRVETEIVERAPEVAQRNFVVARRDPNNCFVVVVQTAVVVVHRDPYCSCRDIVPCKVVVHKDFAGTAVVVDCFYYSQKDPAEIALAAVVVVVDFCCCFPYSFWMPTMAAAAARVDWEIVVSILVQIVGVPARVVFPNLLDIFVAQDQGRDRVHLTLS